MERQVANLPNDFRIINARNMRIYDSRITSDTFHGESIIGRGFFGTVMEATNGKALKVAIKVQRRTNYSQAAIDNEIEILRELRHAHIVRILASFERGIENFVVMELVKQGTLKNIYTHGGLPEGVVAKIVYQIMGALAFCHDRGIAHKDIRMDNIAVVNDNYDIKLIDFGLAEKFTASVSERNVGSRVQTTQPDVFYADVKAVGSVMKKLLFGNKCFIMNRDHKGNQSIDFPPDVNVNKHTKSALLGLLQPKQYLSTRQIFERHCIPVNMHMAQFQ